jgi:transcriptional regulator with XRE-family HTH domain
MVRIRALRDAYGLTAEQLAERMAELGVPVDRNSLYNIERGAKKPSDRVLDAYARALGVNPLDVWQGPLRRSAEAVDTPAEAGAADGKAGAAGHAGPATGLSSVLSGRVLPAVTRWRCYVEHHAMSDVRRKLGGTERVAAVPEVELLTPDQVANWIIRRVTEISKTAEPTAQRLNALKDHPWSVNRSVAAKGRSVYASVHVSPGHVVDLCAEPVPDGRSG